ncbi:hypothetical protein HG530_004615 [Fusarium avenaceum]|nr:hypothetical protein HG530_004615 [Fusarium avenaceum]
MQGPISYPAALTSSKWVASLIAKHRDDGHIYVQKSTSKNVKRETKFSSLLEKTRGDLRNVFSVRSKAEAASELNRASTFPQKQNKYTWAYLFDTKSGNKLHKRAKSAPITTYIPHVLEPINEEREDNDTPVFKFLAQSVCQKHSPTETDREAPLHLSDHIAEDDDAASIVTTCTVLIRHLGLADVPEEDEANEEDRQLETADTMTITHPEVTKIKVSKHNMSRGTTEESHDSPILGLETSQPITTNDARPRQPSSIRFECSGALHPRETLVNVEGSETDAKSSKSKRKTSSAASSVTSLFTKLLGSDKTKAVDKTENETETKNEPSVLHKLRHKAKGSFSLGKLADFIQPAETRLRSSLGINRNNERPTADHNKNKGTYGPLRWNLPPPDDEMGELIRSFSDPRIGFNTTSNNRYVGETPVLPRSPSESSDGSEYDISMEDLPPAPANPPLPFRYFREEISMHGSDEQIQNPKARDSQKAQPQDSDDESSRYSQEMVLGPFPHDEIMSLALQRQVDIINNNYDFSQHANLTGVYGRVKVEERSEERPIRERFEELHHPVEETEFLEPKAKTYSVNTQYAEPNNEETHIDESETQDQESVVDTCEVREDSHPEPNAPSASVGTEEDPYHEEAQNEERFNANTFDMVSSIDWDEQTIPEGPAGNPPTRAAMKDVETADYSDFFKSLQNVRSKSPDKLFGRSGFIGVRPWSKEIASLAARDQMIRDEAAEKFYQQGPSNTGSSESVSDLDERPSAHEVQAALSHPDAPLIDECEPDRVMDQYLKCKRSTMAAMISKQTNHAKIPSAINRNEVIYNEWDRAARVSQIFEAKKEREDPSAAYRRRQIYKFVEKRLKKVKTEAEQANKEARDAHRCIQQLQEYYNDMEEGIHRFTESFGHQRASNLPNAVDLVRITEREERIDYRRAKPLEDGPEAESPESEMADKAGMDYSELVRDDGTEVNSLGDPTAEFF